MSQIHLSIYVVLLGTIFGSFSNVLSERIPKGISILSPPSHCPNCQCPINFIDKIPLISYLLLGSRCRNCKQKISSIYPITELVVALLFLISFFQVGPTPYLLALLCWLQFRYHL
ncbi:MAG: prepilin peptidase [Candidatus Nanopelagicaceae bacterium]